MRLGPTILTHRLHSPDRSRRSFASASSTSSRGVVTLIALLRLLPKESATTSALEGPCRARQHGRAWRPALTFPSFALRFFKPPRLPARVFQNLSSSSDRAIEGLGSRPVSWEIAPGLVRRRSCTSSHAKCSGVATSPSRARRLARLLTLFQTAG